jgi:hypothetical protein
MSHKSKKSSPDHFATENSKNDMDRLSLHNDILDEVVGRGENNDLITPIVLENKLDNSCFKNKKGNTV